MTGRFQTRNKPRATNAPLPRLNQWRGKGGMHAEKETVRRGRFFSLESVAKKTGKLNAAAIGVKRPALPKRAFAALESVARQRRGPAEKETVRRDRIFPLESVAEKSGELNAAAIGVKRPALPKRAFAALESVARQRRGPAEKETVRRDRIFPLESVAEKSGELNAAAIGMKRPAFQSVAEKSGKLNAAAIGVKHPMLS